MKVTCSCGVQLNAPDESVGKKIRCPKCGNVFTVSDPASGDIMAAEIVPPAPSKPSEEIRSARDDFDRPAGDMPRRERHNRDDDYDDRRRDDDDRPRRALSRRDDGYDDEPRGPTRTSGQAVASLIFGLSSFCIFPILGAILGIIFGIRGLNACNRSSRVTGKGLAIAGLIVSGFGLISLPVLIALLVPAVQKVREAAARTQMINNIKQVTLATHRAHDVYRTLPPATGSFGQAKKSYSLSVHLLPYIEQAPLYQTAVAGDPMPSTAMIPPYNSPLDFSTPDFMRVQNFAGNLRVFTDTGFSTQFEQDMPPLKSDQGWGSGGLANRFPDGTSNTILYASRYANGGSVGSGGNVNCSAYDALVGSKDGAYFGGNVMNGFASPTSTGGWQLSPSLAQTNCQAGALAHSFLRSGITVGMADGSVHTVTPLISPKTWNCAVQPNDMNPLGMDF